MKKFLAIILLALLVGGCKKSESQTKGSDKTIYSCSMHHQVREETPGQCPTCGMDLVIVPDINAW